MHSLLRLLAQRGVRWVVADYLPSAKNELVCNFLPAQGFQLEPDGRYRLDLVARPPRSAIDFPIDVSVNAGSPVSFSTAVQTA